VGLNDGRAGQGDSKAMVPRLGAVLKARTAERTQEASSRGGDGGDADAKPLDSESSAADIVCVRPPVPLPALGPGLVRGLSRDRVWVVPLALASDGCGVGREAGRPCPGSHAPAPQLARREPGRTLPAPRRWTGGDRVTAVEHGRWGPDCQRPVGIHQYWLGSHLTTFRSRPSRGYCGAVHRRRPWAPASAGPCAAARCRRDVQT
jgi:hypothetical protein